MSDVQLFDFNGNGVRVVMIDGEPWWVALDVCAVLTIANAGDAVGRLDEADVGQTDISSGGQMRQTNIVNESGLYELIFRSNKPEARAFRRWITSEVLPQIRKTGVYSIVPLDKDLAVLTRMVEDQQIIRNQVERHNRAIIRQAEEIVKNNAAIAGHDAAIVKHDARLDSIEHNSDFMTILGYAKLNKILMRDARGSGLGRAVAKEYRRRFDQEPPSTRDERYGRVFMYPTTLLDEIFTARGLK